MNVKRELGIRALVAAGVVTLAFLAFSDFVATRSNIGWVMSLMAYAISACVIGRIIGPTAGHFKPQWRIGAWVAAAAAAGLICADIRGDLVSPGKRAACAAAIAATMIALDKFADCLSKNY